MAQPVLLQENFSRMMQDVPRDELPADAAWYMQDYIPNLGLTQAVTQGGRLAKRGGFTYASEDLSTHLSSAAKATGMGYFARQAKLCFTTDNNKFGYVSIPGGSTNAATLVSTASVQSLQPYVEFEGKIIITANDGTTAPKYWDGTTFGNLAGSPPAAKYAAVYKDRLVLGNTSALPRRLYFSDLGNPIVWDLTTSWFDTNRDITGFAALPNALLIFGDQATARIRGSIPPPDGDMVSDDPIFNIGCTFPASIAVNENVCCFANEEGVFLTNGTSVPQDLTLICGVKSLWNRHLASGIYAPGIGAPASTPYVSGGFLKQFYVAIIRSALNSTDYAFVFDLATQSSFIFKFASGTFANTPIAMTPQIGDDVYIATQDGATKRLVQLSSLFTPTATNKAEANGNGVNPILETRFFLDSKSFNKRWRYAYLDYRLDDASEDLPVLVVSYVSEPQNTSYSTLATLPQTSSGTNIRAKIPMRVAKRGVAFKIEQTNNSSSTVIDALLADVHSREGGRVG